MATWKQLIRLLNIIEGITSKRSLRRMTDEYGNSHMVIDETLRGRMETKLITKILAFEIK